VSHQHSCLLFEEALRTQNFFEQVLSHVGIHSTCKRMNLEMFNITFVDMTRYFK
jgi:hypothetical protein